MASDKFRIDGDSQSWSFWDFDRSVHNSKVFNRELVQERIGAK